MPEIDCLNDLPAGQGFTRYIAIAESILVAAILGSTLVLAKIALSYLGPLTIVGLRYSLAFLILLPFMLRQRSGASWSSQIWIHLLFIGLSFYIVSNGAIFLGLEYLPATTTSLLLSFVPILVLVAGIVWLKELPTRLQIVGIVVGVVGMGLFFLPGLKAGEPIGIAIVAVGLVSNVPFGILGRKIARERQIDTLYLTAIPLAIGGCVLLPIAFALEGLPRLSETGWGTVLWLAAVNTALVYWLYNHALTALSAFEVSVVVNLTPLITAFWAWLLLNEGVDGTQLVGIIIVITGVVLVQWRSRRLDTRNK